MAVAWIYQEHSEITGMSGQTTGSFRASTRSGHRSTTLQTLMRAVPGRSATILGSEKKACSLVSDQSRAHSEVSLFPGLCQNVRLTSGSSHSSGLPRSSGAFARMRHFFVGRRRNIFFLDVPLPLRSFILHQRQNYHSVLLSTSPLLLFI